MSELKPCPFCGADVEWETGGFGERFPFCTNNNCGARFGTGIWVTSGIEDALEKAWNTRPTEDAAVKKALEEVRSQIRFDMENTSATTTDINTALGAVKTIEIRINLDTQE
jgi:hypothetical protein